MCAFSFITYSISGLFSPLSYIQTAETISSLSLKEKEMKKLTLKTRASRYVIDDGALSVLSADSWTGIAAFVPDAGLVGGTIRT